MHSAREDILRVMRDLQVGYANHDVHGGSANNYPARPPFSPLAPPGPPPDGLQEGESCHCQARLAKARCYSCRRPACECCAQSLRWGFGPLLCFNCSTRHLDGIDLCPWCWFDPPGRDPSSLFMCHNCRGRHPPEYSVLLLGWAFPLKIRVPWAITWGELLTRVGIGAYVHTVLGSFGQTVPARALIRWPATVWLIWRTEPNPYFPDLPFGPPPADLPLRLYDGDTQMPQDAALANLPPQR